jgi:DNA-binding transcriptional MerR regulator
MPEQEMPVTKHYYSIAEVAQLFKVSTSLLRYWEKEFKQLKPQRTKQGIRKYNQADIQQIELIYDLVKKQGYTIRGATEALQVRHRKPKDTKELIRALKSLRSFLIDLRAQTKNKTF